MNYGGRRGSTTQKNGSPVGKEPSGDEGQAGLCEKEKRTLR